MPGEVRGVERLGALLAGPRVERVELVADAVARREQLRPAAAAPRSSAKSRKTTRIITVTAAS